MNNKCKNIASKVNKIEKYGMLWAAGRRRESDGLTMSGCSALSAPPSISDTKSNFQFILAANDHQVERVGFRGMAEYIWAAPAIDALHLFASQNAYRVRIEVDV